MKCKLLFAIVGSLFLLQSANAQRSLYGQVTDVIDGNTIVLTSARTPIKIRIQYIDAPESSQPLYDVVKSHLALLLQGKSAHVVVSSANTEISQGKVIAEGMDVAIQMLRDGAAWYSVPESSSQAEDDRSTYLEAEGLAKAEKRGVWSLTGVRPAYELRLEREKAAQERLVAERKAILERISRTGLRPPTIGMQFVEFDIVCGHSDLDSVEGSQDTEGSDLKIFLAPTPNRARFACLGYFHFQDGKLIYMSRTNRD